MGKTIIISNRLPVKVSQDQGTFHFTSSEGGLATGLGSMHSADETLWIGWPGIAVSTLDEEADIRRALAKRRLVPVFLTEDDISEYYEGFSNDIIWPIFHYYASRLEPGLLFLPVISYRRAVSPLRPCRYLYGHPDAGWHELSK